MKNGRLCTENKSKQCSVQSLLKNTCTICLKCVNFSSNILEPKRVRKKKLAYILLCSTTIVFTFYRKMKNKDNNTLSSITVPI